MLSSKLKDKSWLPNSSIRAMIQSTHWLEIPLFDGKIKFMICQSTIQDLLVQKVVNTIWLTLAPKIKHNVLKETTLKALWEKLENIYASKLLTNRFGLKMELYQLKMEMEGDLHDHINKFNQLVSQLLNADDKLSDEEQTFLLLLASLPRSFKALVQTLLVGRSILKLDEVTVKTMRTKNVDDEHHALAVVEFERERNHSRRHDRLRGRSKSQSRLQRDMSNMQCYYCGENNHVQTRCKQMKEDLNELRYMNKDSANPKLIVENEDDLFLETNNEVVKTKWVMDFAASKHICRNREIFCTLKTNGEFNHFKLGNDGKMKVEGIGSVRMKFHDGAI
ncbi:Retrovirus-related Pol polyprotein from transposon TNT 1-94 [Glycine soja]